MKHTTPILNLVSAGGLLALAVATSGCFGLGTSGSAVSPTNLGAGTGGALTGGSSGGANAAITGNGSMFTPTSSAVVSRIQKVLGTAGVNCNTTAGNCGKVLVQLQTNLPSDSNPVNATGFDQIPLLVYAACADATPSTYGVNTATSVASNQANLVSAGVSMVNQHVGNLAATGILNTQVAAVFTQLIASDMAASPPASTAMTFISVCLAANSFGVAMTGF